MAIDIDAIRARCKKMEDNGYTASLTFGEIAVYMAQAYFTDIPMLLDEVERLQAKTEALEKTTQDAVEECNRWSDKEYAACKERDEWKQKAEEAEEDAIELANRVIVLSHEKDRLKAIVDNCPQGGDLDKCAAMTADIIEAQGGADIAIRTIRELQAENAALVKAIQSLDACQVCKHRDSSIYSCTKPISCKDYSQWQLADRFREGE